VSVSNSTALPRPEEFPVGSTESRAAACALLERCEKPARRIQVTLDMAS